ncbi:CHAD domain-containing protein [Alkalilimnicola ehrlichii]|uniref:CHAD domain-containing protein n=1 Tax=Alkalilimnicola ehrlichii TaxID=351052 RepID=UPI003B9DD5FD
MAFRLDGRRALAADIRKLTRGRVDAAMEVLQGGGDPHEAVHQARKRFKELRALLRLFRPTLGRKRAQAENAWYRDQARALSGYRDAQAVLETVDALSERFRLPTQQEALGACRRALEARRDRLAAEEGDLAGQMANLVDELHGARQRIADWPSKAEGADAFLGGFQRCYQAGGQALQASRFSDDPEAWHEWRKRVKDYWYHVQVLRPLWPPLMKTLQSELKTLSDLLGDDHDLQVLDQLLVDEPGHVGEVHRRLIRGMIAQRHDELRLPALRLGRRLYADRPGALSRRLRAWWEVWREEQGHSAP